MKFFAFILAFYFIALSVAPCCDEAEGREYMTEVVQTAHPHDEQDLEHCSPFCHCSCCHGFVFTGIVKNTSTVQSFAEKQISLYSVQFPSSISEDPWNPPKKS